MHQEKQRQAEVEALAQHIDGEQGLYEPQEAAEAVIRYLDEHGGTLSVMESAYWGKETFGNDNWTAMFVGEETVTTDKGVKVENAYDANSIIGKFRQIARSQEELEERAESDENDFTLPDSYWEDKMESAISALSEGDLRHSRLGSGWFPKSKRLLRVHRDGPMQYVVFDANGDRERGHRDDGEVSIPETTPVYTQYRTYTKLRIDIPYDDEFNPKDDIDELTWDDHHFTGKYENDNFVCWTADTEPREVAGILAQYYDGVAVHENILEAYDG